VAIRPEMTPSISRMVAARRQELGYPARLYSIANFMRYERPQRGREREFWQLNTDIFGVEGVHAESEIIGLAYDVVKAFGASDDMFVLRVNNRKLINYMMSQYLGLDAVQSHLMVKLFDRKNKIPAETFRDQAIDILGEEYSGEGVRKIAKLIAAKSMADLPEELKQSDAVVEVQELFTLLKSAGVQNAVFDITLMRGLDYYTGTVFEVFDTHPDNNRSMFGGGRYDGLVGLFGVEAVPTVGMAPGATMFQHFLESHKLLPVLSSTTDVCIVVPSQEGLEGALNFSRKLREEGVNVEVDITGRKIDKQIKSVLKKNVPFMIFVGNEEIKDELYVLKDIASDTEERLSFERVVSKVRARRGAQQDDEFAFFE